MFTAEEEQRIRTDLDLIFKQLFAQKAATNLDKEHFEEEFGAALSILPSQIIAQEDLIPQTAAEVDDVVELKTDLVMIPVPGSPDAFSHPDLVGSLPFNFGDGTSYIQTLKKDDNSVIPFGQNRWVFIPQAGVLWFRGGVPSGVSAVLPPKITTFRYIGETLFTETESETFNSVNSIETDPVASQSGGSFGDRFLVGAGATGAWVSKIGQIATLKNVNFQYEIPTDGATVKVDDDDGRVYHFEGDPDNTFRWVRNSFSSVRSATISGTDTYTATISPPLTTREIDTLIIGLFANANTGASTLETGFGAISIKKYDVTGAKVELSANDIDANTFQILFDDQTDYILLNGNGVSAGDITGLTEDLITKGGVGNVGIQDSTWKVVGNDILPTVDSASGVDESVIGSAVKRINQMYFGDFGPGKGRIHYSGVLNFLDLDDSDEERLQINISDVTISPESTGAYDLIFKVEVDATNGGFSEISNVRIGGVSSTVLDMYIAEKNKFNATDFALFQDKTTGVVTVNGKTSLSGSVDGATALFKLIANKIQLGLDAAHAVGIGLVPANARLDIVGSIATKHSMVIRAGVAATGTDRKSGGFDHVTGTLLYYPTDNSPPIDLIDITEHRIINDSGSSTIELFSASKIDSLISTVTSGIDIKDPVDTSTEGLGNITLSGEQTLNGVTTSGSRVFVIEQTAAEDNGIYVTAAGAWTRSTDADEDSEVSNGMAAFVDDSASTVFKHRYLLTTSDPIVVGTTPLNFAVIPALEFGTTAGTATEGNDTRVPSQDENDALAGTSGTPSTSNKYVTNSDTRNTDNRDPNAHASEHTDGTDDIQDATNAVKGLATAAQITTLEDLDSKVDQDVTSGSSPNLDAANITGLPAEIGISVSDELIDLTTGTAKITFRMPYAITLTEVRANVTEAPTGSVLTVDINEGGASILSTKLTIDATEKTSTTAATPPVISDASLADDGEITVDIDGVGSTIPGKGLKIWLIGTR